MDITVDRKLAGKCIREFLTKNLGYSSNIIKKLKFSEGGILIDGRFVTVRHILKEGEVLTLGIEDKSDDVSPYTIPVKLPIDIVYEDEHMTVVNKPYGMPAHPSHGHREDTVSNALAYRYRGANYVFRPVNRLDRDTSGCMITANTRPASYKLYRAMIEGEIKKYYIAVCSGCPDISDGVLESYMKRAEGSIVMRCETDTEDPEGKIALTKLKVLYTNGSNSILLMSPITGRTHQIRVQLAGIGCPIVGDDMYGTASPLISRQALHSWQTVLPHPETKEKMTVCAPLSDDIVTLVKALFGEEVYIEKILKDISL